jgi:hypothetical protein
MTDEYDEIKRTNAEIAYEDYVISLMQGKTAEQVDDTKFTPDQIERARHYARQVRMFGRLDPDELEQNYFEEIVKNGPNAHEFEAEMEYRKKYGEDPMPDPSKLYVDRPCQCDEYDGRDDGFIAGIISGYRAVEEPDAELKPGEEINQTELDMYMKFK